MNLKRKLFDRIIISNTGEKPVITAILSRFLKAQGQVGGGGGKERELNGYGGRLLIYMRGFRASLASHREEKEEQRRRLNVEFEMKFQNR